MVWRKEFWPSHEYVFAWFQGCVACIGMSSANADTWQLRVVSFLFNRLL